MNRNKYILFFAVLVMLFILGYWATSASAINSIDIILTPTGAPASIPNNRPEEILFLEEQENIKSVIQVYFDKRYRALSASEFSSAKSLTEILRTICIFLTRAN